jgi:hypothetical protein
MFDLVILRVPLVRIWRILEPLLILGNSEKIDPLLSLCDLRGRISAYSTVMTKT